MTLGPAELFFQLTGTQSNDGGSTVGAGMRTGTSLQLTDQLAHLVDIQSLSTPDSPVTGNRHHDLLLPAALRLPGKLFQQFTQHRFPVVGRHQGRHRPHQIGTVAELLDSKAEI